MIYTIYKYILPKRLIHFPIENLPLVQRPNEKKKKDIYSNWTHNWNRVQVKSHRLAPSFCHRAAAGLRNKTIQLRTNANSIFDVFTYLSYSYQNHVVHPKNAIYSCGDYSSHTKMTTRTRQRRRLHCNGKGRDNVRKSHQMLWHGEKRGE